MAEEKYVIPEHPQYNGDIRKLQDTDPVSASRIVNPLVQRIIENIAAVKEMQANGDTALKAELEKTVVLLQEIQAAVVTAQVAGQAAQSTADAAQTAAQKAQSTADAAQTAAQTAQNTANAAQTAAQTAQSRAVFVAQSSAPSDKGILWIDTNPTTGGLKYYNGSGWVSVPVAYTS